MNKRTTKKNVGIHPTAVIDKKAKIAENVEIGAYCVIGENVQIGRGTTIGPFVHIEGHTSIGNGNIIFTSAVIGSAPQDLKFHGEKTFLTIGNGNTIREFTTINVGTKNGGGYTTIGSNNLIMAYCHIAHDCHLGNKIIMGNGATLGGHVKLADNSAISGMSGVHHYVSIGRMAFVGGCSKITSDVPPYCLADGRPGRVRGLNVVGLQRNKIPSARRKHLKDAFKILYSDEKLNHSDSIETIKTKIPKSPEILCLTEFLRNRSRAKKGRAMEAER